MSKLTRPTRKMSTLKGRITQVTLPREGFTASFTAVISDAITGEARTLPASGVPLVFTFDPENQKKQGIEEALNSERSLSSGTYTFTNTLRGLSLDEFDDAGSYDNAKEWLVGTEFGITTSPQNDNYLMCLIDGSQRFRRTMEFEADQNFRGKLNFNYTPAYLTCGNAPTTSATTWGNVDDGGYSITIDGVLRNVTNLDFTNVGNNDQVAAICQAGLRALTGGSEEFEWDGTQFIIRSGNTTSSSSVTVLSAVSGGTGTDISGAGATAFLDGETGRGTVTARQKGFLISGSVADATERNALTGVANGAEIYQIDNGTKYDYLAGSWYARASGGGFSNSSETVSGGVEQATSSQFNAGTDTGETGAFTSVRPSYIARNDQNRTFTFAVDSSGSDAYAWTLTPAPTSYTNGMRFTGEVGTSNTSASTGNLNSLGVIPIKKRTYSDTETGDMTGGNKYDFTVCTRAVTFNGALLAAATSGTLASNWAYTTGVYSVVFSNGDRRDVTLTNGNTTATWSGGLSVGATASATAQWLRLMTPVDASAVLVSSITVQGGTGSLSQNSGGTGAFNHSGNIDIGVSPFDGTGAYLIFLTISGSVYVDENPGTGFSNSPFFTRQTLFWNSTFGAAEGWTKTFTSISDDQVYANPFFDTNLDNGDGDMSVNSTEASGNLLSHSVSGYGSSGTLTFSAPSFNGTNFRLPWTFTGTQDASDFAVATASISAMIVRLA